VVLFNSNSSAPLNISFTLAQVAARQLNSRITAPLMLLPIAQVGFQYPTASARDLFLHQDLGIITTAYSAIVNVTSVVMLR